jgi:hypothetical protein
MASAATKAHIASQEVQRLEAVVQKREAKLADAKKKLTAAKKRAA